ncbi:serine/arginine repetitive matrix protein 1-like isoform X2 [Triticum urartu]|uniref:serine/arginine repetitive matrix protein 1-like isoform X1 n=1 Tax=Triticum urartu TaxID=4572 RepID=UPI00204473F1|nr:serine/arginine repetitive matrix protein 1-like isoform X1 [Triticum urartu]XP_048536902.1 serine/arginine repetitive matrix protein 1-like isoform X2 [Triticum urartu]XP_048536903.1 serine/arginine repetitive matrix protein 1-like isoform X1 [Triticum urartu]XP_048536904.1 serine/arginine repetitive matrix protein 1-like isoform X2 [Triticum urartu]XP_048536997.1 serine/arginine repetitive matrix protein 1-like isoform X1 [Triticum urartu]XP_048536998.1 serine/arginine repetitive matrix p
MVSRSAPAAAAKSIGLAPRSRRPPPRPSPWSGTRCPLQQATGSRPPCRRSPQEGLQQPTDRRPLCCRLPQEAIGPQRLRRPPPPSTRGRSPQPGTRCLRPVLSGAAPMAAFPCSRRPQPTALSPPTASPRPVSASLEARRREAAIHRCQQPNPLEASRRKKGSAKSAQIRVMSLKIVRSYHVYVAQELDTPGATALPLPGQCVSGVATLVTI